jgi:hypothetical protein
MWTKPAFEEIKMDAEIGSYQQDDERGNVPVVTAVREASTVATRGE